jgi:hypothetical protein
MLALLPLLSLLMWLAGVRVAQCTSPTRFPTALPTHSPTHSLTSPTRFPTPLPTHSPTRFPTPLPTHSTTHYPTPTFYPTALSHSPTHSLTPTTVAQWAEPVYVVQFKSQLDLLGVTPSLLDSPTRLALTAVIAATMRNTSTQDIEIAAVFNHTRTHSHTHSATATVVYSTQFITRNSSDITATVNTLFGDFNASVARDPHSLGASLVAKSIALNSTTITASANLTVRFLTPELLVDSVSVDRVHTTSPTQSPPSAVPTSSPSRGE